MIEHDEGQCPDQELATVVNDLERDDSEGLAALLNLSGRYPLDARLHFLKGSVLAGLQRYEEGRTAMQHALELSPRYTLARFQLGFLEFSSGLVQEALSTWAPLSELGPEDPLELFARGLAALAQDQFAETRALLQRGIAQNTENPLINNDMQLILDEIAEIEDPRAEREARSEHAPASAAQQLLQQQQVADSVTATKH